MAVLHWKTTLASPLLQMSSWQENTSPCNWTGIMCTSVRHGRHRPWVVTNISLPGAGIHGQLGELNFSALPFLTYIDLGNNSLHGALQHFPYLTFPTTSSKGKFLMRLVACKASCSLISHLTHSQGISLHLWVT
uniref:Leucine-rich repeat-containing N-terminal plant-type domain-containing protein n=1 Tax=Aegilops tauschii subsp. strangulata TaxID=200361 RepID=A0A452XIN5_AEGTS